jgi:LPXTG-motif cell wall-anchored protein
MRKSFMGELGLDAAAMDPLTGVLNIFTSLVGGGMNIYAINAAADAAKEQQVAQQVASAVALQQQGLAAQAQALQAAQSKQIITQTASTAGRALVIGGIALAVVAGGLYLYRRSRKNGS